MVIATKAQTKTRRKKIVKTVDFRVLFNDLGYCFELNEATRQVELNGKPLDSFGESVVICNLREHGALQENLILHQIRYAAYSNRYHPVKRYLTSISYDGGDYIGKLAGYFQADANFHTWLYRWLLAAVSRAVSGEQCPVLVLDGPQGIGKSKFSHWLCSSPKIKELFTEGSINPDSKDCRIRATSKWIWEVSEFGSSIRRSDVEAFKAFITLAEVTERAPYAKADEKRPMLACFIGTINNGNAGFLADPSGNRRFIVTHIQSINWKGYVDSLNPDDVWAQAYAAYLAGEPCELTPDEMKLSAANNEKYKVPDALLSILESLYEIETQPINFVSTASLIEDLQLSGFRAGTTNILSKQLSDTLTGLGVQKSRQRIPGSLNPNPVSGYIGLRRI